MPETKQGEADTRELPPEVSLPPKREPYRPPGYHTNLPSGSRTPEDMAAYRAAQVEHIARRRRARDDEQKWRDALERATVITTQKAMADEPEVTLLSVKEIYPAWDPGTVYNAGDLVNHAEELYRVVQTHTAQADWAPDKVPALFVRIGDPGEGWSEWSQPLGSHDAYTKDAKVTYNGKHWISAVDGNVWEPGVVAGQWKDVT